MGGALRGCIIVRKNTRDFIFTDGSANALMQHNNNNNNDLLPEAKDEDCKITLLQQKRQQSVV